MKIVIAASEMFPFIKTGGLADVAGSLPKYLNKDEFEVIAVIPLYGRINTEFWSIKPAGIINIPFYGGVARAELYSTMLPSSDIKVYFLYYGSFFDREGIYGKNNNEYEDNDARFSFFCRGVLEICRKLDFKPDIIHCNDWQTGLIPLYLKTLYRDDIFFSRTKVLFTIHNLSFRGLFAPATAIWRTGLPWSVYNINGTEFNGMFSFLKGGIYYSDIITTVSRRYCREIQTEEYGEGMQGLLRERSSSLYGILNGIDYTIWNPETDCLIKQNYSVTTAGLKKINSEELCTMLGLKYDEKTPVIGVISRLTDQKGVDILAGIIDSLAERDIKLIILGTGDERYQLILTEYSVKYSDSISVSLKHDEKLARMIYAGSDIFLMPSKFEPCGISQMISLKYGAIPVARETGGLADTIIDRDSVDTPNDAAPNGFLFSEYSGKALLDCIDRALRLFENKDIWTLLMHNAMNCNFTWETLAKKYENLYCKLYELN